KGCRSLPEELLCRFLQVGNAGIVDRGVPVNFKAGVNVARLDFHFGRLGVERHLNQPSYHWIGQCGAIGVPDADPYAPDEPELRFDNTALELLLQREELGVKADGPAAKLLLLRPGAPLRIKVSGELGANLL